MGTSPSPLASGPAIVTGTHSCSQVIAGTDAPVGDVFQRRGQVFRCSWDASDARLRGTGVSLVSADIADIVNDAPAVIWADDVTWNEAGTWVGRATGTKDAAGVHHLSTTSLGTGGYAGLRYTDSESGPGDTWPLDGRIEPVSARSSSPPTAEPSGGSASAGGGTCHEALAGTPVGPGQIRGWVLECDITSADRRVAGRQLVLVDADAQAGGTTSLWGVAVIWNEQGTWDGSWTGSAAAGWPRSRWTWSGTLAGSDAYQGLEYRVDTTTPDGVGVVTAGSVITGVG